MPKHELTLAPTNENERTITLDIRWNAETASSLPLLIFVHGFKGFKDWGTFSAVADYFANQDFAFLKLNLSHNGTTADNLTEFADLEAFGNNNFDIELRDIARVLDALPALDLPVDTEKIGLLGHSRGGSVALLKAYEDERIRAVATWAAVSDLVERYAPKDKREAWEKAGVDYILNGRTGQQMPLYFQLYEDTRRHAERYDVAQAVKNLQKPLLVAHGTEDPAVPFSEGEQIRDWHSDPVWVPVAGTDHVFGGKHPFNDNVLPEALATVCEQTAAFFRKSLVIP